MATELQRKAAQLVVEKGGKVSTAMREAGYSPNTAHTPQKLTRTQGYKEILAKYNLNEDRYFKKLDKALDANKWNDFTGEREPDYKTQLPYHTKLGKTLGLEREDQYTTNIVVTPILGGLDVHLDHGDQANSRLNETNSSSSGGDSRLENHFDSLNPDPRLAEG